MDFQVCLERIGENRNDIVEARDHLLPAEIRLQRRDVTDTSKGLDEAAQAILGKPTSSIEPFEVPIREIEKAQHGRRSTESWFNAQVGF